MEHLILIVVCIPLYLFLSWLLDFPADLEIGHG